MKRFIPLILALFCLSNSQVVAQTRFWIATTSSNWNNTANWSTSSGGAGGSSVPGAGAIAIFNALGTGGCQLDVAPTIATLTVSGYTGTLDLAGRNLSVSTSGTFSSGTVSNSGAAAGIVFAATGTVTFSGTTFNVPISGSAGRIFFNGGVYNQPVSLTKTGNANDLSTGGNTFNSSVTLTNNSTNPWQFAGTLSDNFQGALNLVIGNTGDISLSRAATGSAYNGTISVQYNDVGDILFGELTGTSTFGASSTISIIGSGAAGCGDLDIGHSTFQANQTFTLSGNQTARVTLGPSSLWQGTLTATAPVVLFNSSTFNGTTTIQSTSNSSTGNSSGGNVFHGTVTMTNSGDADLVLGAIAGDPGDTFNGNATFNALGGGRIRIAEETSGTVFNANATLNSNGSVDLANRIQVSRLTGGEATFNGTTILNNTGNSSDIQISYDAGTSTTFNGPLIINSSTTGIGEFDLGNLGTVAINGDLEINSTSATDIQIGTGNGGTVTFGNGTITIGASGFSDGDLEFHDFTQTGTAATFITLTGNSRLLFESGSTFNGDFSATAPQILLNGSTFNGDVNLTKNGATNNVGRGGNVFNGTTTLQLITDLGYLMSANVLPDIFNGPLNIINTNTNSIQLAHNVAGNQFNGDITITNTGGGSVYFSNSATGFSTLGTGASLGLGGGGFTGGELRLYRMTQTGSATHDLGLTGTALMRVGPSSSFDGDVNFSAPRMFVNSTTFNSSASLTKTGALDDASGGGNVFNGPAVITNSGSGYFLFANTSPDVYNNTVDLINSGSNLIYMSHNTVGNFYNGNITVTSTGASLGIYFTTASGTSTLGAGNSITVGSGGFTSGDLRLYRFAQTGATPQTLTLTGTSILRVGPTASFDGAVNFTAPRMFISGVSFNSTGTFSKTGAGDDYSAGGNVFGGATTFTNSGSGIFLMASTSGDIHNGSLELFNIGTSGIYLSHTAPSAFNGNIVLNSTSGIGIYFSNNATGFATLQTGRTISIGASGFTSGRLSLIRFNQIGATPQTLLLTGTSNLLLGTGTIFDGDIDFRAPDLYLNGGTYNGTTYLEKTGGVDNGSTGGATFNGQTTIANSSAGYFRTNGGLNFNSSTTFNCSGAGYILPELITGSAYVGPVTLTNTGAGYIRMGYAGTTSFGNDIIVNSTNGLGIYFGESAGSIVNVNGSILVGATGFSAGELRLQRFNQLTAVAQNLLLTNTSVLRVGPSSLFTGSVSFTAPRVVLNGVTFNSTTYLEKTGGTNDSGSGPNTFNGVTTIVNSGSGQFISGGSGTDAFNNDLTLTNTGTSSISVANSAGNVFLGNIIVNNTGIGVYIGNNAASTSTLATGKTISIGGTGFTTGTLLIGRLTQLGTTAQNLVLTGTGILQIGPSTTFNGAVDFRAPRLFIGNSTTLATTAYLEKTGPGDDDGGGSWNFGGNTTIVNSGSGFLRSSGSNVFGGNTTITNSGSNYILLELSSGSTYNGALTLQNSSTSNIRVGYAGTTTINGNVTMTSTNGTGIYFSESVTALTNLNGIMAIGGSGFSAGELRLQRFNQLLNSPETVVLTGTAILRLGATSVITGESTFKAPRVFVATTTFNNNVSIEKTGAVDDANTGGNTFNGTATIALSGSGYFMFASTSPDIFNSDVTISNTGTNIIYMAHQSVGNVFNGNIQVSSTTGLGVYFSDNIAGTATMATGRSLSIGAGGWSTGELRIKRLTQLGTTKQILTLTGGILRLGPANLFEAEVEFRAPRIFLDGGTYQGVAYFEMTDAVAATVSGNGGNTFNGVTTLVNNSVSEFRLSASNPDVFNADLKLFNTGTSFISLAYNGVNTQFNGNVEVNSTNGLGIYIGENNGTSTLAATKTMVVGASGFSTGELRLRRMTQTGATSQTMTLTGTAGFRFGPSLVYGGDVNFVAPQVLLQGATFNGTTNIQKNGPQNNDSSGPNIYNGSTTITNSGTGRMRLSSAADTYNNAVTFVQSNTGVLAPAYDGTNNFAGNVTVNSSVAIAFGSGTGIQSFTGTGDQTISSSGTASPTFARMVLSKASGRVVLATPITIVNSLTHTTGNVISTTTNLLSFVDNATTTGASNASYVDGPIRKTGNDAFTFPVGKGGFYRPITISAPGNTTHHFTAEYFKTVQTFGSSVAAGLDHVSGCEYWILDRTNGTSNVNVTLSWQEASCNVGDVVSLAELRVARWNGTQWVNQGNGGTTGSVTNGTVITSAVVTAFSPFTLGTSTGINPLPVTLTSFEAAWHDEGIDLVWKTSMEFNNDFFTLERSANGIDYEKVATVQTKGNGNLSNHYHFVDQPTVYSDKWYYRLNQTDLDGTNKQLGVRLALVSDESVSVYPNPGKGNLQLTGNYRVYIDYSIIDARGVTMVSSQVDKGQLNVTTLPAGVYTLVLQSDLRRKILRLIIVE